MYHVKCYKSISPMATWASGGPVPKMLHNRGEIEHSAIIHVLDLVNVIVFLRFRVYAAKISIDCVLPFSLSSIHELPVKSLNACGSL